MATGTCTPARRETFRREGSADARRGTGPAAAADLSRPITYVDDPGFHDPATLAAILASSDETDAPPAEPKAIPKGLPAYLEALYRVPLLTAEGEARLFRKMNALKALAERVRADAAAGQLSPAALAAARERIESLLERAGEVRGRILRANQRLVVSIAKRFTGPTGDLYETVSDANLPLIDAVERFDVSRGFRFSTYATWAIRNGLIRSLAVERKRRERFVVNAEEVFEGVADHRAGGNDPRHPPRNFGASVQALLDRLNPRERLVLESRYGLDGARKKSLRQIGSQIGVSKERVRQIEIAAREKLRGFASGLSLVPLTL